MAAALLLGGCGASRAPLPSTSLPASPNSPRAFAHLSLPVIGVSFYAPREWARVARPKAVLIASGSAAIAFRRYASSISASGLAQARVRLIAAARARDRTLVLIRSKVTRIAGASTIVLDAIETLAGTRRRVRSLHLFTPGAEIVIEEYAPLALFRVVDHYVFSPLDHTLKLLSAHA